MYLFFCIYIYLIYLHGTLRILILDVIHISSGINSVIFNERPDNIMHIDFIDSTALDYIMLIHTY